jgi:hypothetical protein
MKDIDSQMIERALELDEPHRTACLNYLNNAKEGSAVLSFRLKKKEIVELFEVANFLVSDKSSVVKSAILMYKKGVLK